MSRYRVSFFIGVCSLFSATNSLANGIGGCQTVSLQNAASEQFDIGQLRLSNPLGQGKLRAVFHIDDAIFSPYSTDSALPLCVEYDEQSLCYVAYPYQNSQNVSTHDLRNLEYQLLFVRKRTDDNGTHPAQGSYYRLSWDSSIGSTLTGTRHDVNLEVLAVQPEDDDLYPISDDDLHEAAPGEPWLPALTTRKGC